MLDTEDFTRHYTFWGEPPRSSVKGWSKQECSRASALEQRGVTQIFSPCCTHPCLVPAGFVSSQYLFISITDTYRRQCEMWQAQGFEVTMLKRNFCFYIRKTGEHMQVPKKPVMRSSQKTSSSVRILDQLFNATF